MSSSHDESEGSFLVLTNDERQFALCLLAVDVPVGWRVEYGPDHRTGCLDHLNTHWPRTSLVPLVPDAVEAVLCELFAEFLGRSEVRPQDDFFVLGGHSLLATRLVNRIKEELRVDLPLHVMFENPTPAELATQLGEMRPSRPSRQIRRPLGGSES